MNNIDTLKVYEDALNAGYSRDEAKFQAETLNKAFESVVTNKDLLILEKDLKIFFTWELAAVFAAILMVPWFRKKIGWE